MRAMQYDGVSSKERINVFYSKAAEQKAELNLKQKEREYFQAQENYMKNRRPLAVRFRDYLTELAGG